jgi:serine/threonine protein kinase
MLHHFSEELDVIYNLPRHPCIVHYINHRLNDRELELFMTLYDCNLSTHVKEIARSYDHYYFPDLIRVRSRSYDTLKSLADHSSLNKSLPSQDSPLASRHSFSASEQSLSDTESSDPESTVYLSFPSPEREEAEKILRAPLPEEAKPLAASKGSGKNAGIPSRRERMERYTALQSPPNLKQSIYLGSEKIAEILQQIFCGLTFLHDSGIIHRDLKPENILLFRDSDSEITRVVISDFDTAHWNKFSRPRSVCGTPGYVAQEILQGQEYDYRVDYYSFGMICYYLMTLTEPFSQYYNSYDISEAVLRGERPQIPLLVERIPGYESLAHLYRGCTREVEKRLTREEIRGILYSLTGHDESKWSNNF